MSDDEIVQSFMEDAAVLVDYDKFDQLVSKLDVLARTIGKMQDDIGEMKERVRMIDGVAQDVKELRRRVPRRKSSLLPPQSRYLWDLD